MHHLGSTPSLMEQGPKPRPYKNGTHGANSRFTDGVALNAVCGTGRDSPIRLVKGTYFVNRWKQRQKDGKSKLQCRQDILDDSFWDKPIDRQTHIVVFSYTWLSKREPDPEGYHLATIGPLMDSYLCHLTKMKESIEYFQFKGDVAVFMDYTCLYQGDRSDEQKKLFIQSLESMTMLYAHSRTTVWALSKTPPNHRSYYSRGWCNFEYRVASLITSGRRFLDIGKIRIALESIQDYGKEVENELKIAREPSLEPDDFDQMMNAKNGDEYQLSFTKNIDREFVKEKYREVVLDLFAEVDRIEYDEVCWTDNEVKQLLKFLPLCWRLDTILMRGNGITDFGAWLLVKHRPSSVSAIDLSKNEGMSFDFKEEDPVRGKTWNKHMPISDKKKKLEWRKKYFNSLCEYYKTFQFSVEVSA